MNPIHQCQNPNALKIHWLSGGYVSQCYEFPHVHNYECCNAIIRRQHGQVNNLVRPSTPQPQPQQTPNPPSQQPTPQHTPSNSNSSNTLPPRQQQQTSNSSSSEQQNQQQRPRSSTSSSSNNNPRTNNSNNNSRHSNPSRRRAPPSNIQTGQIPFDNNHPLHHSYIPTTPLYSPTTPRTPTSSFIPPGYALLRDTFILKRVFGDLGSYNHFGQYISNAFGMGLPSAHRPDYIYTTFNMYDGTYHFQVSEYRTGHYHIFLKTTP